MLKVSGFGTSVQHYGEVDFKPPPPLEDSAAVRVEMLCSIRTAIKQSVLIPVSNGLPLAVATVSCLMSRYVTLPAGGPLSSCRYGWGVKL